MTSYINSIQQFSITIGSGATSNTATITSVGANAFIIWQGFNTTESANSDQQYEFANLVLTNSTTVTAARNTSDTTSVVVNGIVIDPTASLVTGVQAGTIAISAGTSNTATITSVNTSLSAVFYLGQTTSSSALNTTQCGVTLTNATTVTASCSSSGTSTVSYVVVTFANAAINSIQQIASTTTQSSTTNDDYTITSVKSGNSMLAFGGFKEGDTSVPTAIRSQTLLNDVTVRFNRNTTSGTSRTDYCTVIEFVNGVLNQATQRGSISLASASSATATIRSVSTSNGFCNFTGINSGGTASTPNAVWCNNALTNSTTVTAARTTTTSNTTLAYYEVVEFSTSSPSGIVVSTQQVSIVIAAGSTSNTATITSVSTSTASEHIGGVIGAHTTYNASTDLATLVLTNGTTVTATRNTSDASNALTVVGTIIQWTNAAIQSIQRGTITMTAATSNTAAVTAVVLANAAIQFNGSTSTYTGAAQDILQGAVSLTSTTQVTAARTTGTNNLTCAFTIVEFAAGILNSAVQQITTTINAAATTGTSTLTSVISGSTMLFNGGWNESATSVPFASVAPWLTLTNGYTVTATRLNSGSPVSAMNSTVVEFKPGCVNSMNRGSLAIATSAATQTATVTAVVTTSSIANWLGQTSNSATTSEVLNIAYNNVALTNSTTVTATRNTADGTVTSTAGYELVEFVAGSNGGGLFPFLICTDETSGNMQALTGGMRG